MSQYCERASSHVHCMWGAKTRFFYNNTNVRNEKLAYYRLRLLELQPGSLRLVIIVGIDTARKELSRSPARTPRARVFKSAYVAPSYLSLFFPPNRTLSLFDVRCILPLIHGPAFQVVRCLAHGQDPKTQVFLVIEATLAPTSSTCGVCLSPCPRAVAKSCPSILPFRWTRKTEGIIPFAV